MTTPNGQAGQDTQPKVYLLLFTRAERDMDGHAVGAFQSEQEARDMAGRLAAGNGHYYVEAVNFFEATA